MTSSQTAKTEKSAILSPCGTYRYLLRRRWDVGPEVMFIMLNPSTADAEKDDPTIRKCIGFARQWGAGALVVGNLWAFRSTDPKGLLTAADPIGPENDSTVWRAAVDCARIVVAWGAHAPNIMKRLSQPDRVFALVRPLTDALLGSGVRCLGMTADGSPRHPLMLPYTTKIEPFGRA